MGSVFSAKPTIFFKLQPLRSGLFIFRIRIVFSITVRTCKMNDYSHNTNQPPFIMRPTPRFSISHQLNIKPLQLQQKPEAHDRDWTDDLFLTKEVLHHWATWAQKAHSSNPAKRWSGKRDSNPRPSAWKADALANWAIPARPTNLKIQDGEGRIRTSEGWADRFTVCSLWPLGNLPEILGKTRPLKPVKHLTLNLQRRTLESPFQLFKTGAGKGTRTPDLLITNQLLYQLSYASSANKKPQLYTLISKVTTKNWRF